jgi:hypothetical protein
VTERHLTYAYAVLPATRRDATELVGLGGRPVRVVRGSELALAVGDATDDVVIDETTDPRVAAGIALTHYEVVEALFRAGSLLPMRMCTVFDSDRSALRAVTAAAPALLAALDHVSGAAQWTVRVPLRPARDDVAAHASSGADYLRRLGDRRRDEADRLVAARRDATRLLAEAGRHAVSFEPGTDNGQTLSANFLVPVDAADRFTRCVKGDPPTADVALLGPFPPYSFTPRLEPAS